MNTFNKQHATVTVVDDIFGICAAVFLLCTNLIFWALRTRSEGRATLLTKLLEGLFLFALTSMIIATFYMFYTLVTEKYLTRRRILIRLDQAWP